jgi:hypothetical protein
VQHFFFFPDEAIPFSPIDYPTSYLQEELERVAQKETWAIQLSNIANMILFWQKFMPQ